MAEQQLHDAVARAHARGWRIVDLYHGLRKLLPALHVELLRSLDRSLVVCRNNEGSVPTKRVRLRRFGRLP